MHSAQGLPRFVQYAENEIRHIVQNSLKAGGYPLQPPHMAYRPSSVSRETLLLASSSTTLQGGLWNFWSLTILRYLGRT